MNRLNKETFLNILEHMVRIRTVEEMIAEKYSNQEMRCPIHLSIGQEAVPSVISEFITTKDFVVSTHRSHAHYLAKGGSLEKMICEIYGKENGCSRGRGGSMHLTDQKVGFICSTAIVGNTIPIGVGLSYKKHVDKDGSFVCIYLGDAATEEGVFYESINFAAIHNLPCLFICENNLYSVYSNLEARQPKGREIYKMVEAMGVKASQCDGNNIKEIFSHLEPIVSQLRSGNGPFFVEFMTYRMREHCGPAYDDYLGYRNEIVTAWWVKRDPLKLAIEVAKEDFDYEVNIDELRRKFEIAAEIQFETARKSDFPLSSSLRDNVYRSGNEELI